MFSRILLTASALTLISVATAAAQDPQSTIKQPAAQDVQQDGDQSAPKKPASVDAGQTQGGEEMPKAEDQAGGVQSLDNDAAGSGTKKKKASQADAGTKTMEETEATGANQDRKKKKAVASDQTEEQEGDQNAVTKKKQQADKKGEAPGDDMATGSTDRTKITTEKRTVIRQRIVTHNVTKIDRNDIDFNISVGVAIPSAFTLYSLPPTVIEVVPEYEGYQYFVLADGTIVIVEPGTHQIVYVLAG